MRVHTEGCNAVSDLLGLLGLELTDVEVEFFALKDVSVASAGLSGSAGNTGQKATLAELLDKGGGDLSLLSALVDLLLGRGRSWPVDDLLLLLGELGVLLASEGLGVVGLVPLTEWSGIDGDDGALDQSWYGPTRC